MVNSIPDFVVRLRNAVKEGSATVSFPASKLRLSILEVLKREGYVGAITKKGKTVTTALEAELITKGGKSPINGIEAVSKPSRHLYRGAGDLFPVKFGHGKLIVSTSSGVLTDKEARAKNVGGEVLFKIW